MRVHWTDTAEEHLDAIYAYIAQGSSEYAKGMVDRLTIITIRMLHQGNTKASARANEKCLIFKLVEGTVFEKSGFFCKPVRF